ncbi:DUF58 domain-containing protein [Winogradskyella aurantiaca]|uniref:DUF58 domain-containing protein n=1 Tax=Winogradskyella aurantiaca TaxID=2219558 RepID=UPI000E1C4A45|nr:DUF58 domain-containing protein [Winogradskyella aurantiaca]
MLQFLKTLYIHHRFYWVLSGIAVGFLISFWWSILFSLSWIAITVLGVAFVLDILLLYQNSRGIEAKRIVPDKFSIGDNNPVPITISNFYRFNVLIEVIDELPVQFQERDFSHRVLMRGESSYQFEYLIRPTERGTYYFGNLNIYASSALKLIKRKYQFQNEDMVLVYPSIIQMQKYDFLALHNNLLDSGLKKIRRLGHTQEFEQIKEYVQGDDFRTVNWKATAKRNQLMVNQYQDEKSQPIYALIDSGRVMKMPFNGLKLLDYAINATLAFSNVALKKHDKVGLGVFSKQIDQYIQATSGLPHLNRILESLYNIDTRFHDSDYSLLYGQLKRKVTQRSLLLLFTNFEHSSALKRQIPYLQAMAKKHMLVVIIFENTELDVIVSEPAQSLQNIYHKTIAQKFSYEKTLMIKELQKHKIQSILTAPEELTINTINKYLEIKARGLL